MINIDKNKKISFITGLSLVFGLSGCFNSTKSNSIIESSNNGSSNDLVYTFDDSDNAYTGVFYNSGKSVLIPCEGYKLTEEGCIELQLDFLDNVVFSSCDVIIFDSSLEESSYERALKFSLALSDEVYNYEDIMNGDYDNIALGYNISNELGLLKKKKL